MADELNTPTHRWYERRNNIALAKEDVSAKFIYDSGIQKINSWINSQPWGFDYPQLVLDFDDEYYRDDGGDTTFASAITHTRASTATYVDSTGTLQTAAINEPRLGHHVWNGTAWVNEGLLHESEARTNLVVNSENFALWDDPNGNMTQTASVDTSPDGGTNAYVVSDNGSGDDYIYRVASVPADTATYTYSLFVKKTVSDTHYMNIALAFFGGTIAYGQGTFDTNLGVFSATQGNVVAGSALVEDSGDWWRISISSANNGTGTSVHPRIYPAHNSDGTTTRNNALTGSKTVFGAQLEAGPTPSSYIPTSGATATRAAETLTIPAANLPWPTPEYIGPELVTNGTFDTDISGWTGTNSARTLSWSSGALRMTANVDGAFSQAYQTLAVEVGSVYLVTADIGAGTVAGRLLLSNTTPTSASVGTTPFGNNTSVQFILVATTTTLHVSGQLINSDTGEYCEFDNISVREINPLAVSIQMDGRVTYADTDAFAEVRFLMWSESVSNQIRNDLDTNGSDTGQFRSAQTALGIFDTVTGPIDSYLPDVLVPFNVASRNGSTFVNIAIDGTAMTADTTPVSLPNLSATDLTLGQDYNGTIRTFRMWGQDIGDTGLVEATT
jgi:hypothetical protein